MRTSLRIFSLVATAHAHVSMLYRADQPAAIRNAQTATGNGRASVASPCGGANTFGSNGIGTMKDGDTITLDMRYAAGHNGAFRMAYACNGENTLSGDELEADAATLTATANDCTVTGANGDYGAGQGGGATASGQDPMSITCTLPLQNNIEPVNCVLGLLDQRDWGGCLDVSLVPAQAALPPAPPPAPFVPSSGTYYFSEAGKIDTSAGVKDTGTFSCCALATGALNVPTFPAGQPDGTPLTATFSDAVATNCPATVPDITLPPPANTASEPLVNPLSLTASENGNKYSGTYLIANQPYEVILSAGQLTFTNTGGQQPVVCDGAFALTDAPGSTSPPEELLVLAEFTLQGTVDDITDTIQQQIKQAVATAAQVSTDAVQLRFEPASVKLSAVITPPAGTDSATVKGSVQLALGTSVQATAAFGYVVEAPPVIVEATAAQAGVDGGGGLSNWGYAAIFLVIILFLVVAILGYLKFCGAKSDKQAAGGVTLNSVPPPPPTAPPPGGVTPLPPGWQPVQDPTSGQTYYYNNQTGATTWTHPAKGAV